ncbi:MULTISPECIES: Hpt domain-containing protein [Photobacterium]|uniref:Phosphorelay protein LuxU n=1 Tax=Photobacterium ganghwense TaxID=320778 RepID=A0A0J1K8T1_9GAMM|nr:MULTISPECIES: Hpt domain-containing protein [Photobacterium]KLV10752.1 phosphorelay protein LuxU [Photobacterium ganghwense]MBV1841828.1 Hpt domain-containing protein [Photobacterium ganghwense]PSU11076.1 Hpt domain-containing protein [Photobacterium ganghwense]QSV13182.1 Hpt domain-containing protein [Photobacterium ganghwense]
MTSIINADTIKRMADEVGHDTLQLLLNVFSDELDQYFRQLSSQPTISQVREISHAIKSSAASFGADELAVMAQECESRVKQGQDQWILDHLPEYRQMVEGMAIEYRRLASLENPVNCLS